jgi:transposase
MSRGQGSQVGYNVQLAVDEKHRLIVEHEVTNAVTDQDQLTPISERAKAALGVEKLEVVADMGYYDGAEVKKCEAQGITVHIPKPDTSANTKLGLFGKERFHYGADKDVYRCPAGQELTYRFGMVEKGRAIRYYSTSACSGCLLKPQCTRNQDNRRITRWEYEDVLERMQLRTHEHPEKMRQRHQLVEHPFGSMKRWMEQGYFLMRRQEKVATEMSLTVLAYNLKRVLNLVSTQKLSAALA